MPAAQAAFAIAGPSREARVRTGMGTRRRTSPLNLDALDAVAVVETAYAQPEASDEIWLRDLARALAPAIEDQQGHAAWLYRLARGPAFRVDLWGFVGTARPGWVDAAKAAAASGDPRVVRTYRKPVSGFAVVGDDPEFARSRLYREVLRPTGLVDQIGLMGADPEGYGVAVVASHGARLELTDVERLALTRLTTHMMAGFRLRRRLAEGTADAEAVFDVSGALLHAEGAARDAEARTVLRAAVTSIDAVRRKRRSLDAFDALARWKALVGGRWTFVDQFERDGRHFLVAKPNAPRVPAFAKLARREAQVVAHAALGHSNKIIAYELGLTESSVAAYLTRAKAKLGARSRMDLVAVTDGVGPVARHDAAADCVEVVVDGERFTVLASRAPPLLARLTVAERDVIWAVLAGKSNDAVARERACSPRTIANQLASSYKKLGVASRSELAGRLRGARVERDSD